MLALLGLAQVVKDDIAKGGEPDQKGEVIIQTPHLDLLPYRYDRITTKHLEWLNDKNLMRFSEQRHFTHTRKTQEFYLMNFPKESFIWLIRYHRKEPLMDIGTITAMVDPFNGLADMGILIGDGHQGKGYGLEAWEGVMKFLIEGNIRKIECGCRADNEAMKRLATKAGMKEEGRRWSHFLDDRDYPVDSCGYAAHNGRWKANITGGQLDYGGD